MNASAGPLFEPTPPHFIEGDETWNGVVELDCDLGIAAGAHLILSPGTRLVFKSGLGGLRSVTVRGTLEVRGRVGAPVTISGENWTGIFLLEHARAALEYLSVEGAARAALSLYGSSRLEAKALSVSGGSFGLYAADQAEALLRGSVFTRCAIATRWESCGRLALISGRIGGGAVGVSAAGGTVLARDMDISATESAWDGAGGTLRVRGGTAQAPEGVRLSAGRADLRGVALLGADGAVVRAGAILNWSGGSWRGTRHGVLLDGGSARLSRLALSGGERGVSAPRFKRLSASALAISGARVGVETTDGDSSWEGCFFEDCATGLSITAGSAVARGCTWRRCAMGARAGLNGRLFLDHADFVGARVGVEFAGGSGVLRDASWSDCATAVLGEAGSRLSARGLSFEGGGSGVHWLGDSLRAHGIEARRMTGAVLALAGRRHTIRGLSVRGAGVGVRLDAGSTRGDDWSIAGADVGVLVRGFLEGRGLRLQSCGAAGIIIEGGEALLRRCEVSACLLGARLEDGTLFFEDCVVFDCAETGVALHGAGARLTLLRSSVRRCGTGLAMRRGHADIGSGSTISACKRAVSLGAEASLCAREDEASPPARGLRRAVLAAPSARAVFGAAYAFGESCLGAAARGAGAVAAWTHRGWTTSDWEPGISDLDAVWLRDGLDGRTGWNASRSFWRAHAVGKAVFPFLGEILLASPEDADLFARAGSARAWELSSIRPLAGRPPAAPSGEPDRDASLAEAFAGYTRACECLFSRDEPWPVLRRHAVKSLLDGLRHLDAAAEIRRAEPRASFRAQLEARDPAWRARLSALDATPEDGIGRHLALGRAVAALLKRLDDVCASEPAGTVRRVEPDAQDDVGRALVERVRRALDGRLVGMLADDLHRTVAVLDDGPFSEETLGEALAGWARLRRLARAPESLPLPLTPRAWRAWVRLPYMDHPLPGADAAGAEPGRSAGRAAPGRRQRAWGRLELPGPFDPRSARRCAASFLMSWRWMAGPGRLDGGEAADHWTLSRLLGLRLALETGTAPAFFDVDALASAYGRVFPDAAAGLESLLSSPAALADPERGLGAFVSEQAAALRAALRRQY